MTISTAELTGEQHHSYGELWSLGISQYPEFFRVHPDDEAVIKIPTNFNNDSFTLGAFKGDQLIGIVSVEREARIKLRHRALVFRMFVHPAHAGQGVGRQLLQQVISKTKASRELKYLYLTVLATNTRAISLYESLGFATFSQELGAVNIDGHFIDEYQMALQYSD